MKQNKNRNQQSKFNIYAIGHAHIDPVWQWNLREGYLEVFSTFRSALDRLKEFPSVCFVAGSAQFYEWIAENAPNLFKEIKRRVREGRWILVGGWWVECDVNCPCGESLVRQGLYAQKYFLKHFNKTAKVGFSPDTFGHAWTLPQILKKQGMKAYFYMRPEVHEKKDTPAPIFRWVGPDDSCVIAVSILESYCATDKNIEQRMHQYIDRFSKTLPGLKTAAIFYGVGNHGGGPTIAAIRKIEEMRDSNSAEIHFDSPENYIAAIRPYANRLPIVRDELQHHARGCYSACAAVKMWDLRSSSALMQAEKIASLASRLTDYTYPMSSLREAWKKILFNQFHDILAGTSIEEAYDDAMNDYGFALSTAQDVSMKAMHALTRLIDTEGSSFVAFNPCSWQVDTFIEFETERPNPDPDPATPATLRNSGADHLPEDKLTLYDSENGVVPFQVLPTAAAKQENQPHRIRMLFKAQIPALGYQTYRLGYSEKQEPSAFKVAWAMEQVLENDLVRIEFDRKSGAISSYFDKKRKCNLFAQPGAVPIVLDDWDDTWGHRIRAYDREIGRFTNASFKIIERGPDRARLQVSTQWGNSSIVQAFSLYRDSAELACSLTIDWHEPYRVLKISFPTMYTKGVCTYSIPYGFIQRPMNGDEEPGQRWVDVSETSAASAFGFSVINASKCGYSVKDGDIRLTVFHSTAWSHHHPEVVGEEDHCRYMEQGIHEFSYLLIPHAGNWRTAHIPQRAESYVFQPLVFHAGRHHGKLGKKGSLISTTLKNISITAIKKAEDNDDLILRCVELLGKRARGIIEFAPLKRVLPIEIKPCEIKTFRVPSNPDDEAKEVNLLEENL
ncbi:alpha-mannosidase [bacterium]|nr:alpha-mannosidase [bacterium]